jgi:hypothetical protein
VTVRQTARDSSTADSTGLRYTTPAVFRMPVTIRVGTTAGDVTRRVTLTAREQTIAVPGVATPPTMVVFDDGNTILKTLNRAAHRLARHPAAPRPRPLESVLGHPESR